MMVKRNTPARPRQKRGASARSEAKKSKARNASPLPDKAPQLDKLYKRPTIIFIVCFAQINA